MRVAGTAGVSTNLEVAGPEHRMQGAGLSVRRRDRDPARVAAVEDASKERTQQPRGHARPLNLEPRDPIESSRPSVRMS